MKILSIYVLCSLFLNINYNSLINLENYPVVNITIILLYILNV